MNNEDKHEVYKTLWFEHFDLEYPCDDCSDFDCEKCCLVTGGFIKKKHIVNVVDWETCLDYKKQRRQRLEELMRLPFFKKFSTKHCSLCQQSFHELDLTFFSETAKKLVNGSYRMKSVHACKKCVPKYKRRKTALNVGYNKW